MAVFPIINTEELNKQLGNPFLRVVDCRFMLQDVNWGVKSYAEAHIPGAVYADLNKNLSSRVGPKTGRHPLPSKKDFVAFVQLMGISNSSKVVVYDDASGSMAAARMWWLLRAYGLENVQVLDGSFSDWKTSGFHVTSDIPAYRRGSFQGQINPGWIVDADTVEQARNDSSRILIDARSHDRFMGLNEIIDSAAGYIPGAVNRPSLDNLDADKKFKSTEILKSDFQSLIANRKTENVILYCGSGVTACFNQLALEVAGLYGAKIYPGSWSEWITDPSHQIAIGE